MKPRRVALISLLILLAAVLAAIANALAYTYTLESLIRVDDALTRDTCVGLIPPPRSPRSGLEIDTGRLVVCHGLQVTLYESLSMRFTASPGTYLIEAGSLLVYTPRPIVIVVYVEDGLENAEATLEIRMPEGRQEVPLKPGSSTTLSFGRGLTQAHLVVKLKTTTAGSDYFRVGFYAKTPG